ncbi:MAG: hypothetical protein QOJ91_858 [Sphingomonadales bacterium]|jgi:hypothetical protein|nr:hypothetical protein [Sphingomonadales bacterium]
MLKQVQHDGETKPRYAAEMISLLLFAAATIPQPADLKSFQDWTVGCDNGRACQAVALMPEDMPDDAATMSVRRGPENGAQPVVAFDLGAVGDPVALSADGRRLPVRLAGGADGETRVVPADTAAVVAALRSAGRLQLLGADGKPLGTVSLNGASAALLYMDEQQRRVGTPTALVRRGPGGAVPAPPPLPVVLAPPLSRAHPVVLSATALQALRKKHGCTLDEVGGPEEAESTALTAGETLLLLACGSGAYNVSYVPFIVRRGGRAELATFDYKPGWWAEEGKPMLINADWDKEHGLLTSFAKGRGLADCGTESDYAWDGRAFRLVEQAEMDECRGSRDYITTWRAWVVRR